MFLFVCSFLYLFICLFVYLIIYFYSFQELCSVAGAISTLGYTPPVHWVGSFLAASHAELCKAMPSATTSVRYNPPAASTAPSHTAPFSDHQLADLVSGVAVMVSGSLGQGVGPKAQAAPKSRLAQGATKGESGEGAARTTLVTAAPQSPWGDVLSSWLSAVHWHTQARLPFFTYGDLTRMLLAFRKMGHQLPHSWLAALRYRDLRTASAYDLLVILQTMAFFDHKPPSHWLWSFCLATLTCGPHSPLEEGGYAQDSITLDEDGSVADMAKGLGLQGWTVLELVELMRALADLGAKPSNQWVLEWLSAAELKFGTCNPQLCLQMLGSLERLHITPPQQWTTNLIEYGLRPHVTAQKLTIQQVAQVMRGLNKACYVPSEDFLSAMLKVRVKPDPPLPPTPPYPPSFTFRCVFRF